MQQFVNNGSFVLAVDLSDLVPFNLELTLVDGALLPASITPTDFVLLTIEDKIQSPILREIIKITGYPIPANKEVLTIERAQEGTSEIAWLAGTKVNAYFTAGTADIFQQGIPPNTAFNSVDFQKSRTNANHIHNGNNGSSVGGDINSSGAGYCNNYGWALNNSSSYSLCAGSFSSNSGQGGVVISGFGGNNASTDGVALGTGANNQSINGLAFAKCMNNVHNTIMFGKPFVLQKSLENSSSSFERYGGSKSLVKTEIIDMRQAAGGVYTIPIPANSLFYIQSVIVYIQAASGVVSQPIFSVGESALNNDILNAQQLNISASLDSQELQSLSRKGRDIDLTINIDSPANATEFTAIFAFYGELIQK